MNIIDITRTLQKGMAVWPGDTPYNLQSNLARENGDPINLTTLTMSAHTGSHADAPYHFTDKGLTIAELDLRPYWGLAQVISVSKRQGPLTPADLGDLDLSLLSLAPRLLVRSAASDLPPTEFPQDFVYPSPDLADFLGQQGIILYGSDAPSMDHIDSQTLPGHHALFRNGIAILEGLILAAVPDGLYELAALPLKIGGGDGSPVRAVLKTTTP